MASTEPLDQVVEQTSSLDISNGPTVTNETSSQQIKESKSQDANDTANSKTNSSANSKESAASSSPAHSKESSSTPAAPSSVKSLPKAFRDNFRLFSKFGDTKSDGKLVTLSQSDKWMKQAKVIDGKKITTTDTAICFKKFK